ncbi:MAG: cbb3-type cytochrome c oxidase subunit 3 [Candidatus Zixiibacteriota bacterium]
MISEALSAIRDVAVYPVVTLLIFFTAFLGIVVWTLRLRKSEVVRMSRLPLDETMGSEHEGEQENG